MLIARGIAFVLVLKVERSEAVGMSLCREDKFFITHSKTLVFGRMLLRSKVLQPDLRL